MSLPQPRPGVLTLKPYVATHGKTTQQRVIKLSANEGALGPSPKAVEAYKAVAADLHRYPEGGSGTLAHAIAKKHGLDASQMANQFVTTRPFVTSNIIGATTMEQLKLAVTSVDVKWTEELEKEIEAAHLDQPNPAP